MNHITKLLIMLALLTGCTTTGYNPSQKVNLEEEGFVLLGAHISNDFYHFVKGAPTLYVTFTSESNGQSVPMLEMVGSYNTNILNLKAGTYYISQFNATRGTRPIIFTLDCKFPVQIEAGKVNYIGDLIYGMSDFESGIFFDTTEVTYGIIDNESETYSNIMKRFEPAIGQLPLVNHSKNSSKCVTES